MLDALQNPIVIAVVVLILLALIAVTVLLRRRRAAQGDVRPPPELGPPVDYTSMPYEEPKTLGQRLSEASIGVKLLLALVPLALIIAAFVVWQAFFAAPPNTTDVPPPPPPAITDVSATLASAARIVVDAKTNLPDGTVVTAAMKEGGEDFPWPNTQSTQSQVSGGQVRVVIERASSAPQPRRDQEHTVVLTAQANNQPVNSDAAKLTIPPIYVSDFYRDQTAAAPTAVPTKVATSVPAATAVPTAKPTAIPTPALTAKVFNGGNVRDQPVNGKVLDQINANETVTLLEKNAAGTWYKITNIRSVTGWVSATLLTVDDAVKQQVPITGQAPAPSAPTPAAGAPTPAPGAATQLKATVFNGGNVRERPINGKVLDQINAKETVTLLERTADAAWFKITNIRGVTGWVSATLLTIDDAVKQQVPVAK